MNIIRYRALVRYPNLYRIPISISEKLCIDDIDTFANFRKVSNIDIDTIDIRYRYFSIFFRYPKIAELTLSLTDVVPLFQLITMLKISKDKRFTIKPQFT